MYFQTAALRHNCELECVFINAPFDAKGEPDSGIKVFYPDRDYYEWTNADLPDKGLDKSVDFVIAELRKSKYDGLVGFSQGAAMTTRLAVSVKMNSPVRF